MTRSQLLLLSLTLAGCKDDTTEDTAPGGNDTSAPEVGDTLTIHLTAGCYGMDPDSVEGATVALDDGAGGRTEIVTGADGLAVFDVDWSLGPVDITAHADGSYLQSVIGIETGTSELEVFWVSDSNVPDLVAVTGEVSPRLDDSYLQVTAYDSNADVYQTASDSYSLNVIAGVPQKLVVVEYTAEYVGNELFQDLINWQVVEHDGLSADGIIDIDMSEPATPVEIAGSYTLPDDDALNGEDCMGYVQVHTGDSWLSQRSGWATWTAPSTDDGAIDFTAEHAQIPDLNAVMTALWAFTGDNTNGTVRFEPGMPDSWAADPVLIPTPKLQTLPSDLAGDRAISFVAKDAVTAQRCVVLAGFTGAWSWFACTMSSDDLRLPEPPSSLNADPVETTYEVTPYYLESDSSNLWSADLSAYSWGPTASVGGGDE